MQTTEQKQEAAIFRIEKLLQYLEETQHKNLRLAVDHFNTDLKQAERPGDNENPRLAEFEKLALETEKEMSETMKLEERIIFPQIRALLNDSDASSVERDYKLLAGPVQKLIVRHHELLEKMRNLLQMVAGLGYEGYADSNYRKTFADLFEFYSFYEKQVYLEENLLFPSIVNAFELNK